MQRQAKQGNLVSGDRSFLAVWWVMASYRAFSYAINK